MSMIMNELLPLSWAITGKLRPHYHHVFLPISRKSWITFADIPSCFSQQILCEDIIKTFPDGYVIRGCTPDMVKYFTARNCHIMRTGIEAVLDFSNPFHFQKKTVQASLARGKKRGFLEESSIGYNAQRFEEFRINTIHADKPQLRNLFRDKPSTGCRLFVFRAFSGQWLGAITISERGKNAVHTELMLRHREAPGDIMECLVAGIFEVLKSEGKREWSLGEVPFIHLAQHNSEELNFIENLSVSFAANCKHAYNFEGLYCFKNKFVPQWRPVMLCTNTTVTPLLLMELSEAMGFTGLLINESISQLKQWLVPI